MYSIYYTRDILYCRRRIIICRLSGACIYVDGTIAMEIPLYNRRNDRKSWTSIRFTLGVRCVKMIPLKFTRFGCRIAMCGCCRFVLRALFIAIVPPIGFTHTHVLHIFINARVYRVYLRIIRDNVHQLVEPFNAERVGHKYEPTLKGKYLMTSRASKHSHTHTRARLCLLV